MSLSAGHGCRIYVADGQVSGGTDWAQLYGCGDREGGGGGGAGGGAGGGGGGVLCGVGGLSGD
jgi:hypothetical protein